MTARKLHSQAVRQMQLAELAQPFSSERDTCLRNAFALEKQAAMLLIDKIEAEPTRSILYRSSASLGIKCCEYREAIELAKSGLAGQPPYAIRVELLEVLARATDLEAIPKGPKPLRDLDKMHANLGSGFSDNSLEIESSNDEQFLEFQAAPQSDILFVPELYEPTGNLVMKSSGGSFRKWLMKCRPLLPVEIVRPDRQLVLRSGDFYLPIAYLSDRVKLTTYLELVVSYVLDSTRGALLTDRTSLHLQAVYYDTAASEAKYFRFQGGLDGLKAILRELD